MLRHVELGGLAEPEVAELVDARSACRRPSRRSSHALHGETEGNPFFIEEVVRHLRDSDHDLQRDVSLTEAGRAGGRARGHRAAPAAAERRVAPGAARSPP